MGDLLRALELHQGDIRTKGPTGEFTDVVYRDDRTYNDVRFLFGYQRLSSNSNWLFDVYGGPAFRATAST